MTTQLESQHFTRLGRKQDFRNNLCACKALCYQIKTDQDAGTIEVHDDEVKVMWAIDKGNNSWLVGYHREYFRDDS